jgi:elongation factor P--beta-lysine ligase
MCATAALGDAPTLVRLVEDHRHVDIGTLAAASDALTDCAEACNADAEADLSEDELFELVMCIRLCQEAPVFVLPPETSSAARLTTDRRRHHGTPRCCTAWTVTLRGESWGS